MPGLPAVALEAYPTGLAQISSRGYDRRHQPSPSTSHHGSHQVSVQYQNITTDQQLRDYCRGLSSSGSIAFDTEFVSENTYRPVLCLIQVSSNGQLAVIDAMAVSDLTPFWEALADGDHETLVHSGRGELEVCLRAIDRVPAGLFDVQIAAALNGMHYPAGFSALISKVLGES